MTSFVVFEVHLCQQVQSHVLLSLGRKAGDDEMVISGPS